MVVGVGKGVVSVVEGFWIPAFAGMTGRGRSDGLAWQLTGVGSGFRRNDGMGAEGRGCW